MDRSVGAVGVDKGTEEQVMSDENNTIQVCSHPTDKRSKRDGDDWVCDGCGSWFDSATVMMTGRRIRSRAPEDYQAGESGLPLV